MMNKAVGGELRMSDALHRIQEELQEAGDLNNAGKMQELLDKISSNRMNIAFCGHFSAGKSTIINQLCGHPLLPSSPIPTSANIVSIRNGVSGASVTHKLSGEEERIELEQLDKYAVNGTDIEHVEITYPLPFLGEHTAFLDTPGIDSTDHAHEQSTKSALHLADVVFYIMDYNHVQSEINLAFTKKMKEWGKPLYLIVNMIDKHKEHELPFPQYQEGTLQAFRSWGIEPDGILYVTMKQQDHPQNEWKKLRYLLRALMERGEELRLYSIDASSRYLIGEHGEWCAEQNEPVKAELREAMGSAAETEAVRQEAEAVRFELDRLHRLPEELVTGVRKQISSIIDNANITPALTRVRAEAYLQSRKPGFKTGLFARAAQTAAEIEKRLLAFQLDLAEQVEAQLDWHLRDALTKATGTYGLPAKPLTAEIEALHIDVTPQWLAEQVNPGAVFGGEYTINYTKQVAAEVKQLYRKRAYAVIDLLAAECREQSTQAASGLAAQLAALEGQLSAYRQLQRLEHDEAAAQRELLQIASWRKPLPPALPDLQQFAAIEDQAAAPLGGELYVSSMDTILAAAGASAALGAAAQPEAAAFGVSVFTDGEHGGRLERKAAALLAASSLIEAQPAMGSIARSLRGKAERLRQRTFTIALFGAFSAGKSSFANALMGERILPVSPNPTTAAINRIVPPEEGWPHGTARVKMKTADVILQDVMYSLDLLGVTVQDMPSALDCIRDLSPSQITVKGKPHYSFLRAVEKGWNEASPNIGQDLRITKEQFPEYVADETKSCFVERIELFYANPLTDLGIILVDTPGADSINARHTGVAFNYIKNADAILFVTYYNHAFSGADREFLLQLGRVKDSFEMDKMFFIVNASDLASTQEELSGVVQHVTNNLLQHGIRHPRIYPISSYLAAEGKINGSEEQIQQSGIRPFEADFVCFTYDELSEIAIHAADRELSRAIHIMAQWIQSSQEGEDQRNQRITQLKLAEQQVHTYLENSDIVTEIKELSKEIQELLYYVKQRTLFRFGELYRLAFNPSSFREASLDPKQVLISAWKELQGMIAHDLSQEVLATTLRVENRINLLAAKRFKEWEQQISNRLDGYESSAYESQPFVTPEVLAGLEMPEVPSKLMMGLFKNAKHFFEGEGKDQLRSELESRMNEPVAEQLEKQRKELEQAYVIQMQNWLQELKELHQRQLSEHVHGLHDALEMKVDVNVLNAIQQQLKELLN
ncbi:dynamin family protein [Paenibacillus sp. GP183]|jgi:GTPase Era involved in 16S rRNA processing|uniref:dynamin family protein n=1 Tax=Paenibacillus sp. GP183 TaxID=1882751 RepID=UPI00089AACF5|nr:dynamin family protein [Paenibacillus sp. GP183]SEB62144.1 Dynamin family protein [Paenibacillus sp. GP183]